MEQRGQREDACYNSKPVKPDGEFDGQTRCSHRTGVGPDACGGKPERRWLHLQGHARNLVRQELLRMFCQPRGAGRLLLVLVGKAQAPRDARGFLSERTLGRSMKAG
jgi:hypothetical protein